MGAFTLTSCDDTTDNLGADIMPPSDFVKKQSVEYDVYTESYSAGDSVLARSSMSYLGRFTDPETNTIISSDFLTQFHCIEDFAFPDSIQNDYITSAEIKLYIKDFVGDSLTSFKLSVYPLTKVLDPDADYYTNIDPMKYCDSEAEPITVKWFTLSDRTVDNSARWKQGYYNNIVIPLPRTIGQQIYDEAKKHPETFENSETWINSGLPCSKGFYFKLESGDGALAYIDVAQFVLDYRFYDEELECDTTGTCIFAATEEIIQATRFENYNLDKLLADDNATYLKSPAGLFTMATLPTDMLNYNDTVNQAKLVLTRYNDIVNSSFKLKIPQCVLMVRLDDYKAGYFEQYKVSDNNTSFLAAFDSKTNTYEFSNISHLLNVMRWEKEHGVASPDYNKVLIIPVEPTYDGTSASRSLVKLCHDFSMTSARLVGGKYTPLKMQVIYSNMNR